MKYNHFPSTNKVKNINKAYYRLDRLGNRPRIQNQRRQNYVPIIARVDQNMLNFTHLDKRGSGRKDKQYDESSIVLIKTYQ